MPSAGGISLLGGGHIRPLLAEIEQTVFLPPMDPRRLARRPQENKGNNLQEDGPRIGSKVAFQCSLEFVFHEAGGRMESQSKSSQMGNAWYRGAVIAFALALCLGASPLWAAQDQQEVPQGAVQQSPEDSAPDNAPQAPPAEYLQVPPTLTLPAGTDHHTNLAVSLQRPESAR
jgi:hypothetical protein